VSHSCLTAERSFTNLILQAAMLAVSATTHIYVSIDNRYLKTICGPTHRPLSLEQTGLDEGR
jgi:hypothetical protein